MKRQQTLLASLSITALVLGAAAQANGQAPFDEIIVFGDSLSDTGNVFISFGAPPSPPYFDGRFSNGPVAVEHVADQLGFPALLPSIIGGTNFAWGGAETGPGFGSSGTPNLGTQIGFFFGGGNTLDGDELIAVNGGGNDAFTFLLSGGFAGNDPVTAAENFASHISTLALAGGEVFLVQNLAGLGQIPLFRGTALENDADDWAMMFNDVLEMELDDLEDALEETPGVTITILQVDAAELFEEILDDPEDFDLTNVTDPACLVCAERPGGIVPNPDEYLFWDNVHPTAVGHKIAGDAAVEVVMEELDIDDDDDSDDDSDNDSDDDSDGDSDDDSDG